MCTSKISAAVGVQRTVIAVVLTHVPFLMCYHCLQCESSYTQQLANAERDAASLGSVLHAMGERTDTASVALKQKVCSILLPLPLSPSLPLFAAL
jgi:hypothetical protein